MNLPTLRIPELKRDATAYDTAALRHAADLIDQIGMSPGPPEQVSAQIRAAACELNRRAWLAENAPNRSLNPFGNEPLDVRRTAEATIMTLHQRGAFDGVERQTRRSIENHIYGVVMDILTIYDNHRTEALRKYYEDSLVERLMQCKPTLPTELL